MNNTTHLGLDVHKESIAAGILRPGSVEPDLRTLANTPEALRKLVSPMDRASLIACYEAGPTGYDTYRVLERLGVRCEVIAPALIPRRAGKRIKTDRIDARNLARLHRAGELTAIRVPTPAEEGLRELIRTREDLKDNRRRAQQRIKGFLLRRGCRYPGNDKGWTQRYDRWIHSQSFDEPAAQLSFEHYLAARTAAHAQLQQATDHIESAATWPQIADMVARLRCLRGLDTISAVTIAAEVSDFRRFANAPSFMAFTGLVPSEHSSGHSEHRGPITKTGNRHVRRVLVEAAWTYRHRPNVGRGLSKRHEGHPPEVLAYCWSAQLRLHARYNKLSRRSHRNTAVVAVGRELSGFVWGLMNDRISV